MLYGTQMFRMCQEARLTTIPDSKTKLSPPMHRRRCKTVHRSSNSRLAWRQLMLAVSGWGASSAGRVRENLALSRR